MVHNQVNVNDPGQIRIALRDDLRVSLQSFHSGECYLVEDPSDMRIFQVGRSEAVLLGMFDGQTTLNEAIRLTTMTLGENAFSQQEAIAMARWLIDARLATVAGLNARSTVQAGRDTRSAGQPFDPLAIRVPLVRPDRWLRALLPWCGWLFSKPLLLVWGFLCLSAIWRVATHWDAFEQAAFTTFSPGHWWSLMVAGVLLKVLHETAHGVVCHKYGGRVSEAGLMLLWGLPVPYVDVTSSWLFPRRLARIHTAAAGMQIETLVAAVLAWIWQPARIDWLSQFCVHVILLAAAVSLVFNGNPLMRFDGYYIFMDAVGIPNLATRARRFWAAQASRYLWGAPMLLPHDPAWQRHVVAWYGLLSAVWRYFVYTTLALLTVALLPIDEAQAPLAAFVLVAAVVAMQWIGAARSGSRRIRANRGRALVISGACLAAAYLVLFCVPWPGQATAVGIVDYAPLHILRSPSRGIVQEVHVRDGEFVLAGAPIVTLHSPELEAGRADVELAIEQSKLTLRTLHLKGQSAAHTAELQNLESLKKLLAERNRDIDRLVIRAPANGHVVSRGLRMAQGHYLQAGAEVALIGEDEKEVRAAIAQDDLELFAGSVGRAAWVRVGGARFQGRLTRISPRGTRVPIHPALCATEGGSLPVGLPVEDQASGTLQLRSPHFTAFIELTERRASRLGAGQRARVAVSVQHPSIGAHALSSIRRWCRDKVRDVRSGRMTR